MSVGFRPKSDAAISTNGVVIRFKRKLAVQVALDFASRHANVERMPGGVSRDFQAAELNPFAIDDFVQSTFVAV